MTEANIKTALEVIAKNHTRVKQNVLNNIANLIQDLKMATLYLEETDIDNNYVGINRSGVVQAQGAALDNQIGELYGWHESYKTLQAFMEFSEPKE